jgi:hypothetical protein
MSDMTGVSFGRRSISGRLICTLGAGLLWLSGAAPAEAAGIVTNCTTFGPGVGTLQAALEGGGTITFACSGTITGFPPSVFISMPTVINGTGRDVVLSGNKSSRLFFVSNTTLDLIKVTLADAVATSGAGPALFVAAGASATVTDSIITGNFTNQSGALLLDEDGVSLTIVNSTIAGNTSVTGGAGIRAGGATLTIVNSTISGNQTTGSPGFGPALYVAGSKTKATVTNSTISGNVAAENSSARSAVFSNGELTLINSTVVGNDGGGIRRNSGTVTLFNSIVASQVTGPDCETPSVVSEGHNLDSDGTCNLTAPGDQPNVDPLLEPLQDNGGRTLTHALLAGSPAINAGARIGCPTTDQRGIARPQGPSCDIGAFEFDGLVATVALDGSELETGQTITYRATVNPGQDPVGVDVYLGALLPDLVTFLSFVEVTPGQLGVVFRTEPIPYRANSFDAILVEFEHTFGGAEPVGIYFTYAAVIVAGSDPFLPENQLSLAIKPFGFNP